uniref:Uncharacterized protein n=1 Tax=Setaria italica TaxID=4555 RepID=K3YFT2_SETIT
MRPRHLIFVFLVLLCPGVHELLIDHALRICISSVA